MSVGIYLLLIEAAVTYMCVCLCVSACADASSKSWQIRRLFFKAHLFSVEGKLSINADLCRLAGWKSFGRKEPLRVEEWLLMGFYSWTRERGQWAASLSLSLSVCVFVCMCVFVLLSCWNNPFKSLSNSHTVCFASCCSDSYLQRPANLFMLVFWLSWLLPFSIFYETLYILRLLRNMLH